MLELETSYLSETGGRQRNEDACGYWQSAQAGCWVLSDGAGGHGSGDIASKLVVSSVLQAFSSSPEVSSANGLALLKAANMAVIAEKTSGATRDDMHATACILLLDRIDRRAVFAHVGDSRIYHFRDGKIIFQTRDHSLVQQMVDAGFGDSGLLRSHPKRNLLTSAIGSAGSIEMSVSPQPFDVQSGDVFLLCSDGWWEYLDEREMEATLSKKHGGRSWLEEMAITIVQRGPGGQDNYSALCVGDQDQDDRTVLMNK